MKLTIPFKDTQTIQVQETLLDRLLRFVNPRLGQERLQEHVRLGLLGAMAGSYVGASMTRRSLSGWRTRTSDPDAAILPALSALRERSRDLVRNEPLAAGALNTVVTNVVGTGLRLQARIHRGVLAMTDDEADELETLIEREWRLWSESQDCDAARTCTFASLQDLVFRAALESGDVSSYSPWSSGRGQSMPPASS